MEGKKEFVKVLKREVVKERVEMSKVWGYGVKGQCVHNYAENSLAGYLKRRQ